MFTDKASKRERLSSLFRDDKTDLFAPIESGDGAVLSAVIAAGADVNAPNADGKTPLLLACIGGRGEIVSALLRAGAKVDVPDRFGYTPLMAAASNLDESMIDDLLSFGADAAISAGSGLDAFEIVLKIKLASKRDKRGRLKVRILAKLAQANAVRLDDPQAEVRGLNPLQWAASANADDVMEALLKFGADPFIPSKDGKGVMEYAFPNLAAREIMLRELVYQYKTDFERMRSAGRLNSSNLISFFEKSGMRSPGGWTHWAPSDVEPILDYLNDPVRQKSIVPQMSSRQVAKTEKYSTVLAFMNPSMAASTFDKALDDVRKSMVVDMAVLRMCGLSDAVILHALSRKYRYTVAQAFGSGLNVDQMLSSCGLGSSGVKPGEVKKYAPDVVLPIAAWLGDNYGMTSVEICQIFDDWGLVSDARMDELRNWIADYFEEIRI